MKMSILNIIISFFLIFQFCLRNLDILYDISNISKANALQSDEECGDGCRLFKFLWMKRCICPTKPENKHT